MKGTIRWSRCIRQILFSLTLLICLTLACSSYGKKICYKLSACPLPTTLDSQVSISWSRWIRQTLSSLIVPTCLTLVCSSYGKKRCYHLSVCPISTTLDSQVPITWSRWIRQIPWPYPGTSPFWLTLVQSFPSKKKSCQLSAWPVSGLAGGYKLITMNQTNPMTFSNDFIFLSDASVFILWEKEKLWTPRGQP